MTEPAPTAEHPHALLAEAAWYPRTGHAPRRADPDPGDAHEQRQSPARRARAALLLGKGSTALYSATRTSETGGDRAAAGLTPRTNPTNGGSYLISTDKLACDRDGVLCNRTARSPGAGRTRFAADSCGLGRLGTRTRNRPAVRTGRRPLRRRAPAVLLAARGSA